MMDPRLADLAKQFGVATDFWDWKGRYRAIDAATVTACLAALGVSTSGEDWVERALADLALAPWRQPIPPCTVVRTSRPEVIDVHVPAGRPAHACVELESGAVVALEQADNWEPDREIDGRWLGRASFRVPVLDPGYHTLVLTSDDSTWRAPLIVVPDRLALPAALTRPVWGIAAQAYSVWGEASWGLGDFADLTDLMGWAGTVGGADCVLVNPLHAAEVCSRLEPSPYLPTTRRFLNPWYIRPEAIPEYATAPDDTRRAIGVARAVALGVANGQAAIDRDSVWAAKSDALRRLFALPRSRPRNWALEAFIASGGVALTRYATWCALSQHHGSIWRTWPEELRDPNSVAVRQFAVDHADDIAYYCWLQWVAAAQLGAVQGVAGAQGMRLGLMTDLAVGVNRDGADTWASPELYAQGVTVGAPPDAYNQEGQDWSQPPWRPDALRRAGYEPYRAVIRAALAGAGALRVDHIIGAFRLWWVPDGMGPAQGTYVHYDHDALIGILILEATRAGAMIIGEDLGTVEPGARRYLAERGILGTSVLWFEMDDAGALRPPESWRALSLASVTTHDLPPTLGYLAHDHVRLRHDLGLLTEPLDDEIARDADEQARVRGALVDRGLLAADETDLTAHLSALYRYLAFAPSLIKVVALTDIVGETRTQNQPGTRDEYPNWRVPLGRGGRRVALEELYDLDVAAVLP